ncbi:MAG: SBBP repeat-containing protein [Chitinophagaceae bacterium]
MKSFLLLFLYFLYFTSLLAQPTLEWAKSMGGSSFEEGRSIAIDAFGNVYTTGIFFGAADFDPGPGTAFLTANNNSDVFISKLDASGNFVWAKQIGGNSAVGYSIAVDVTGNVYTTGDFNGIVDFDPGPGTYELNGIYDIFISKLDASGNFVWAINMGGTSGDIGNSIAVDSTGSVYTTGYFLGTADFDPGPGTAFLTASNNNSDVFVSKLDASGNFVWAINMGGTSGDIGNSIAVDSTGSVYTTGYFLGTADFDPGPGTAFLTASNNNSDVFVSKLDASGNFVWAKNIGGSAPDYAFSIAIDASSNVYTTGVFQGTADFDPGAGTFNLTSAGGPDIFISKLDVSGDFLWAKNMGGTSADFSYSIKIDASGNVYTTGYFLGTADFDPGPGTVNLTGSFDIFVSKLDASGNFVWAINMGGTSGDIGNSIAVDTSGYVYATGYFGNTADFDPGPGIFNLTSDGIDIFVVKLMQSPLLPLTMPGLTAKMINTREVQLIWQTSSEQNTIQFVVERSADGTNFTPIGTVAAAGNSSSLKSYSYSDNLTSVNGQVSTVFYRLKNIDADSKFTYSKSVAIRLHSIKNSLHIFPNPVKNMLFVNARGINETANLLITDVTGKIVKREKLQQNGSTSFSVDVESLPKGKYYLILQGKEKTQVQKFVRQ